MLKLEKLNSQTFDDIVETAVKSVAVFDTEWNNLQASDPGMTLVDLFAWLKALQHEYMSVILPESQRRFLELLDIRQRPASGSGTLVALCCGQKPVNIPEGTKWKAGGMVFENRRPAVVHPAALAAVTFDSGKQAETVKPDLFDGTRIFEVFPDLGEQPQRDSKACMTLWFDREILSDSEFSVYFGVYSEGQKRPPVADGEFCPMADICWEVLTGSGWANAELLLDSTHGFLFSGVVRLRHSAVMAKGEHGFAVRARLLWDGYDIPPAINRIYGNALELHQQDTLVRRDLFEDTDCLTLKSHLGLYGGHRVFTAVGDEWREISDYQVSVLPESGQAAITLAEKAERSMVVSFDKSLRKGIVVGSGAGFFGQKLPFEAGDAACSSIGLLIGRRAEQGRLFSIWEARHDFFSSGPGSRHFSVDRENGCIRFGDHEHGMIPPKGEENILLAELQTCCGKASNIKSGVITSAVSEDKAILELNVRQITAATGGMDEEAFDAMFLRAAETLKTGENLVTKDDYLSAVRAVPGIIIENCRVLTGFNGAEDDRITIVVQGAGRARRSAHQVYESNIRRYLDKRRLLNAQIDVVWPRTVKLVISGRITTSPYYSDAEQRVKQRIGRFVDDLNQCFGSVLSYGELYSAIDLLECVFSIESLSVEALRSPVTRTKTDDLIVPANSVYEIERVEFSFIDSL